MVSAIFSTLISAFQNAGRMELILIHTIWTLKTDLWMNSDIESL